MKTIEKKKAVEGLSDLKGQDKVEAALDGMSFQTLTGGTPVPPGDGRVFALRKEIRPDPGQPRKEFPEGAMEELRDSIRANGVQDAVIVRTDPEGKVKWMLVEGERRWRAAGDLKIERLPIEVREMTEEQARRYQRIVGTQRLNLSALEEARSLQEELKARQAADPKFSVTDLAKASGKGRSTTYELLSLLSLQPAVSKALQEGKLLPSHATRIALVPSEEGQKKLLEWAQQEIEYGNPPSVKDLEYRINRDHCKSLKGAPFKLDKVYAEKYPGADEGRLLDLEKQGTCDKCPMRSGNLPNWPDSKNPNMCLMPACWRMKALSAAARAGKKVMQPATFQVREKKFWRASQYDHFGSEWGQLSKLMGKHAPVTTVTIDKHGELIEVFEKGEAKAALEKAGVKFGLTERQKKNKAKEKEEQAVAGANEAVRTKLIVEWCPAILEKLEKLKDADAWKLAAQLAESAGGWMVRELESALFDKAKSAKQKVLARLLGDEEWHPLFSGGEWDEDGLKLWKQLGIDLKRLEATAQAAAKDTKGKKK